MSRGSTWGEEEIRYLISIWSDENIKSQLENAHKNADIYKKNYERMKERGYEWTAQKDNTPTSDARPFTHRSKGDATHVRGDDTP